MIKYRLATLITIPALIFAAQLASAQSEAPNTTDTRDSSTTSPDNTRVNQQNDTNTTANADDQKEDTSDLRLTQRIRKSVIADKALSTYAHNVKIIAVNGTVTLNGVVRSEHERDSIAMKAQSIAGKTRVVNDLTIAPPT
jgi:osmotically-inducible protein OsmY